MRTKKKYLEDLTKKNPKFVMKGKEIKEFWNDTQLFTNINSVGTTFDYANDPKYEELMTCISPLIGEKINRFTHLYQSPEDMLKRIDSLRLMCHDTGHCIGRCVGIDGLHSIGIVSYDTDQAHGTNYHQRFLDYMKYFQKNDLTSCGAVTDVKGDRGLRPHQQADPDLYLRIVEKKKNGIIVRGAKANISHIPTADEMIVVPSRGLTKEDADYAVAFAIPVDTKGVTCLTVSRAPAEKNSYDKPLSSKYASSEALVIFDDVFVPSERIFLCGEWDLAAGLGILFGSYHRHSHCGCISSRVDNLLGACSLMAKYNGIREREHVKNKLYELLSVGEMVYSCGFTASLKGFKTPSGIWRPNFIYSNLGKNFSATHLGREMEIAQDIAGGLIATMPYTDDYENPVTRGYINKYLRGPAEYSTEDRIRVFRLLEDMTTSGYGAMWMVAGVIGAGPAEAQRVAILKGYDVESKEKDAMRLAGLAPEEKKVEKKPK